ncbi:hypothetical protein GLOIN_2v1787620 [Rhizophagus irregularis DAOM 181602=DAOM 197198]|uniref:Uncharacterized protein n=1 Tax=Rhizophagus irregularis (strain DAOM 181602 / DAOM 197198 / MUCL 43194) TaxID=747089 RepID=A0A2P4P5F5_RHIID|nr:hypothetical protein GLOIN_2v1787620 [Rhizophagus irregularis DAOM 181602=DAOM 197198]POG60619.1 hypothetical protein GLOIN_2v1787620 [Rhizophagus irregularis DAOM 181602=DAOM 197198]|eukprot:XP_025167485.1 hypothetical protein GLOIN_2v1787620 [Rhizophagus irregularis DAOM 181602=DAOM 197198]
MGSSDNFFSDIISLAINWNNYLDPNVDEDELIEDGLRMDEFMGTMYAAFGLLPLLSFLLNLQTITTPPALSVINLDILPLPHPEILSPSGDWPLSSNNAASASNKCSRTVSADDMNVDITLPSVPASNSVPSVPSGLPKVAC